MCMHMCMCMCMQMSHVHANVALDHCPYPNPSPYPCTHREGVAHVALDHLADVLVVADRDDSGLGMELGQQARCKG